MVGELQDFFWIQAIHNKDDAHRRAKSPISFSGSRGLAMGGYLELLGELACRVSGHHTEPW